MGALISQITAFLPAFIVSPTMWAGAVLILSSSVYPKRRALYALLGSLVMVAVIGAIAVTAGSQATDPKQPSNLSGTIDLVLGALLVLLAARGLIKKNKSGKKKKPLIKFSSSKPEPLKFFVFGILLAVTNTTSLASYLAAAKLTVDSGLNSTEKIIAMAIGEFYFLLPVFTPLMLVIAAPGYSKKFLGSLTGALEKYGRYIIAAVLLILGIYLARKGIKILYPSS